jgi:hypothetical protein
MRRREFITLVGGVAAWPLAARTQQPAGDIARVGVLGTAIDSPAASIAYPSENCASSVHQRPERRPIRCRVDHITSRSEKTDGYRQSVSFRLSR